MRCGGVALDPLVLVVMGTCDALRGRALLVRRGAAAGV